MPKHLVLSQQPRFHFPAVFRVAITKPIMVRSKAERVARMFKLKSKALFRDTSILSHVCFSFGTLEFCVDQDSVRVFYSSTLTITNSNFHFKPRVSLAMQCTFNTASCMEEWMYGQEVTTQFSRLDRLVICTAARVPQARCEFRHHNF